VPELVAIRRKGAFGASDWNWNLEGSGGETTRDLVALALALALDERPRVDALRVWSAGSGPEIVPRRWRSRVLDGGSAMWGVAPRTLLIFLL
jgi:hypothetical protein